MPRASSATLTDAVQDATREITSAWTRAEVLKLGMLSRVEGWLLYTRQNLCLKSLADTFDDQHWD